MKNRSLYVEKLRGLQRMKNIYFVDSNYNVPFFSPNGPITCIITSSLMK